MEKSEDWVSEKEVVEMEKGNRFRKRREDSEQKVSSEMDTISEALRKLMLDATQKAVEQVQDKVSTRSLIRGEVKRDRRSDDEDLRSGKPGNRSEGYAKDKTSQVGLQASEKLEIDSNTDAEPDEVERNIKRVKLSKEQIKVADTDMKMKFLTMMLNRLRRKGDPLQNLFLDIRCMQSVAFEGEQT